MKHKLGRFGNHELRTVQPHSEDPSSVCITITVGGWCIISSSEDDTQSWTGYCIERTSCLDSKRRKKP
jgi:hypothetical protein